MLVVIDYHMGNLGSVMNMLRHIGVDALLSSDPETIRSADRLILPGVGAFDTGMQNLHDLGITPVLNDKVLVARTPILGVCLGMQLFGQGSEEGRLPGFGWVDAFSRRFRPERGLRVPHMGWNTMQPCRSHPLIDDLLPRSRFYFVHSFFVEVAKPEDVLAQSDYGAPFASAIAHNNIIGMQFHPEKSLKWGMQILKRFSVYV